MKNEQNVHELKSLLVSSQSNDNTMIQESEAKINVLRQENSVSSLSRLRPQLSC